MSASISVERDIVFGRGGGQELRLDVYRPPAGRSKRTAVVQLFGGGFTRGSKEAAYLTANAQRLAERGYVGIAANYRLAPATRWPGQLHDAKAAVRWTRANAAALDIDPEKIAVCGYSAGGQLALVLAGSAGRADLEGDGGNAGVSSAVAACIGYYPSRVPRGADLPLLPDGAGEAEYSTADPLTYVGAGFPPTLQFCGTNDPFLAPAKELWEMLQGAGVAAELHLFAGLPHIFDALEGFGPPTSELCDLFLDRYVANPRTYEPWRRPEPARA